MKRFALLSTLIATFGLGTFASAAVYNIDSSHSTVGFNITHMMISKVNGRFDKYESAFKFDDKTGELSDVTAKIDVTSVNTNEPKRDAHLKSPDFFGATDKDGKVVAAKQYMTFKSNGKAMIDLKTKAPVKLTGDLTVNGVTKPVTLEVTYKGTVKDPFVKATHLGFSAKTTIKRGEFGMKFNKALETGGVLVGEDVAVELDGEATPAQATLAK
jgi:polyisoprenoid-binding protein YceI